MPIWAGTILKNAACVARACRHANCKNTFRSRAYSNLQTHIVAWSNDSMIAAGPCLLLPEIVSVSKLVGCLAARLKDFM